MNRKILYFISLVITSLPWLFLFEVFPSPYHKISTILEVTLELFMFAALLITVIFLRKDLKKLTQNTEYRSRAFYDDHRSTRKAGKIIFILAVITLFLLGVVLLLIGIAHLL